MQSKFNSIRYRKCLRVFFLVMLVFVSDSGGFKVAVTNKVKRKIDSASYSKGNDVSTKEKSGSRNATESGEGRGFFPPGSIFTLGKVLNFFPVGGERECQPSKGYSVARSGICLNPYDCRQRDGKAAGDCAHGLGVCCVFEVTCGGVVQNNLTYFMSPGFPELWSEKGDCNITIDKSFAGIMQLKIDFVNFNIGQPNRATGDCDGDVMTIGDPGSQFKMCGQNHGQHIYYTLPTGTEKREADDLPSSKRTQLSIRIKGPQMPRLWLMRLAQMPLMHSAPHECLQYFTGKIGTFSTFNFAINGRYLADQDYKICVRRNIGYCSIRYTPCDERSFRIGSSNGPQTYTTDEAQDGMMPVNDQTQEDEIEGSGQDPQINLVPEASPSLSSRIWSFIWPSWMWGQGSRSWGFWSPYAQHYKQKEDDRFFYQGYGNFGLDLKGFGRQGCQDRITIPCDNDYFISNTSYVPGVCDPHHCGLSFCPGFPFSQCHIQSSTTPFTVSVHFGAPSVKANPEENIGACLMYEQVSCEA